MALTHSELRRLNRIFGEEFGFNPHGQPNFRWMRTEEMFWFIDHGSGWRRTESGLLTYGHEYERRCWADRIGRCWTVAKWTFTPEDIWVNQHGDRVPWPKHGEWNPIENWKLEANQDPNLEITLEFCAALRFHREHSFEDWVREYDAEWEAYRKAKRSELESAINDAMTVSFNRLVDPFGASLESIGKKQSAASEPAVVTGS